MSTEYDSSPIAHLPLIHPHLWLGSRNAIDEIRNNHPEIQASMCVARNNTCNYDESACPFDDEDACRAVDAKDNVTQSPENVEAFTETAADQIHELVDVKKLNTLVHCRAGRNRSSASIVRYAMKYRKQNPTKVIEYLRDANLVHRQMERRMTLSNLYFESVLQELAPPARRRLRISSPTELDDEQKLQVFEVTRHPSSALGCSLKCSKKIHIPFVMKKNVKHQ